ncbi:hypothetical protein AGLY_000389 [Aphis glycines]|uniref:Uncharacterized protein n=1 Tax=Aphis glycines TaxID=307491 RepID=A0A6G0U7C0_APHGL|nr:hypothetical protein AGLY_000389 [Aphis glycines]
MFYDPTTAGCSDATDYNKSGRERYPNVSKITIDLLLTANLPAIVASFVQCQCSGHLSLPDFKTTLISRNLQLSPIAGYNIGDVLAFICVAITIITYKLLLFTYSSAEWKDAYNIIIFISHNILTGSTILSQQVSNIYTILIKRSSLIFNQYKIINVMHINKLYNFGNYFINIMSIFINEINGEDKLENS